MKKNSILLFCIIVSLNCFSQKETKNRTVLSAGDLVKEKFSVLSDLEFIKHGLYNKYFNGILIIEGFYTDDNKDSLWKYNMNSTGIKYYGNYKNDLKEGEWVYMKNDTILAKINYLKDSIIYAISYQNNNKLIEEKFKTPGNGKCIKFYPNGNKRIEYNLKTNYLDSLVTIYFPNGKIHRKILMKNDEVFTCLETYDFQGNIIDGGNLNEGNGKYIQYTFDKTGKNESRLAIRTISNFENGIINGYFCRYDEKDSLSEEGEFFLGQKNGKWFESIRKSNPYYYYLADKTIANKFKLGLDSYNFSLFDISPDFPGGDQSRIKFLVNNVKYPSSSREKGEMGTVYVSFIINKTGEIKNIKILRGVSKNIDNEVLRVISLIPMFLPGFADGMPVEIQFNMPMKFSL